MIVVDTNVVAYLLLGGNHTELARSVFNQDSEWAAPILWRSEFRSVLSLYLRKDNLDFQKAVEFMEYAERLFSGSEYQISSDKVLELVKKSKCSAYDCEFVALANDLKVPLITCDQQILSEFPSSAVSLKEFTGTK